MARGTMQCAVGPCVRTISLVVPPVPPAEPKYSPQELIGVVPVNPKEPYDCKEIMLRLADHSKLREFKPQYDFQTVCVFVRLGGWVVGMLGNNGPITPQGATKAAQFIQLCDQSAFPLVFLQNTTGFMVGTEVERAGAIKHGSKMIQAVSNARVPRVTIVVAQVLSIIGEAKMRRMGQEPNQEFLKMLGAQAVAEFTAIADPLYTSARMFDDGLIDPRDTRQVLLFVLDICRQARATTLRPNTFGIARL